MNAPTVDQIAKAIVWLQETADEDCRAVALWLAAMVRVAAEVKRELYKE